MTGKVIDRSATSLLILILPFAVLIVLLFKVWPVLLALFIISISWSVWQQYQWKQWSKQVNPYFNQLIKENQGCLTALDLSLKANLSGSAAKWYLDKKAEEFGAQCRDHEDKGTVYYFLTASALGSIFEESEPPLELESEAFASQAPRLVEPLTQTEPIHSVGESSSSVLPEPLEPSTDKEPQPSESTFSTDEVEADLKPLPQPKQEQTESLDEKEDLWVDSPDKEPEASKVLIQAELAKRLDVHSSTVGKRKSDPDFSEWSQSRDPEGIAWVYSPDTKEFLPLEKKPESEQ
jgi:hypothetical protein